MLLSIRGTKANVDTAQTIDEVFRAEAGAVLATLIRLFGDFDRAEEALQEACVAALESWTATTLPTRPGAWLLTTARRKAIDRIRREHTTRRKEEEVTALVALEADERRASLEATPEVPSDLLRLICCCCHPALSQEAQVALTLRTVCRLTTAEIANAFVVPEATMAQRLVRVKSAKIPYRVPEVEDFPERLESILAVIYLIFNEGYFSNSNASMVRRDLCDEALHLSDVLMTLLPEHAEVAGLRALLLLQDSRREARVDARGELVLLADQDRSLWNQEFMEAGRSLIQSTLFKKDVGPYQLQAAIAAIHSEAIDACDTDWEQIVALYGELRRRGDSPILQLNQIVAISMLQGPERGLELLSPLEEALAGPFAETKEQLGGYYLVEAKDLDEALKWAAKLPSATHGSIEVRPILDFGV